MDLYLIRHATAVPRSPALDDATRPLTPRGRRRWDRAVRGLRHLGVGFDVLRYSPKLRAVQTAEPLRPLVHGKASPMPRLTESPSPALLAELDGACLGLVGHEPYLSELLALLTVGDAKLNERFLLKKGGVAWLRGEPKPGGMQLVALLTPKLLRAAR